MYDTIEVKQMNYLMNDLTNYYYMNFIPILILLVIALICTYEVVLRKHNSLSLILITVLCGIGQGAHMFFMGILADNQVILSFYNTFSLIIAGITLLAFILQIIFLVRKANR